MRALYANLGLLALVLGGCQPAGYVNPTDDTTGFEPPAAGTVYAFDNARATTYLDADLQPANAVTAAYVNTEAGITPMPVNGALPGTVGNQADLLAGVGFGTYANPDYRADVASWADASPFKSTLTAEITLQGQGDAVTFCRSFATTCVTVADDPLGLGVNVALLTLAANAPDTEIGEIQTGTSAAIRGTGSSGLTIALADQNTIALPFIATAGTPFELSWTVQRGSIEGSLDYTVSINGNELGGGNTATDLAANIVRPKGVALVFDTALGATTYNESPTALDYSYAFDGTAGSFDDPFGVGVAASPQPHLGYAPLYVYASTDSKWAIGTDSGTAGAPHAVQAHDGIIGAIDEPAGNTSQHFVWSAAFNGDDFAGTALEGLADQGGTGGGFYPSPSFCYGQILPTVEASVKAAVRQEVARQMYIAISHGVSGADSALPTLVAGLDANFDTSLTYTPVGLLGDSSLDTSGYVTVGTDYADSNVDTAIATSVTSTYDATLSEGVSTTFRTQLTAVLDALEANDNEIRDALIGADQMTLEEYLQLETLQIGLTTPPGSEDGVVDGAGTPHVDEWPRFDHDHCNGYDCNVAWVVQDIARGSNDSGRNPSVGIPALASTCLWGVPASPAVDAQDAVFTLSADPEDYAGDHPTYPAIPATPAVPPVRETAAASMNQLVMGIYADFIGQVFGPSVPASNFSMEMVSGDPTRSAGPSLTTLTISSE